MTCLGVIGGSGIYDVAGVTVVSKAEVSTPYGPPSGAITQARYGATKLLFLPRHGEHHRTAPHEINYRANICALKSLGATQVVSLSAVGSLKEAIQPGHVVLVDQYLDLTKRRRSTFFEEGIVGHVSMADPTCKILAAAAAEAAESAGAAVHRGGSYVCIEGPQFSSRAESFLYKSWGASVIGMTAMPEAKLAREAGLPYCTLAMCTDYDCWHESEADVSVGDVLAVLKKNSQLSQKIIAELATRLPDPKKSPATQALAHAIITKPEHVDPEARERLSWLLDAANE